MKLKIILSVFAALAFMSGFSAENPNYKSTRVDFTSNPEGALVTVDGEDKGHTPVTLFDLAPGEHRIKFSKKDWEADEKFLKISPDGGYLMCSGSLEVQKGLLLVTSIPAGADISLNSRSLGVTPKLITSLSCDEEYTLLLQAPGYQDRKIEVKFNGRTPLVKEEKLVLDSGTMTITSDPDGADVIVNGVPRGKCPVTVSNLPKGRTTVELKMAGFANETRELQMSAGDHQNLFIKMIGNPGSLRLTSIPDGARFYINDRAHGKGPVVCTDLAPGLYTVKAECEGYETLEKEISVGNGEAAFSEFRLKNIMGRIEVRTKPAGATVLLDGKVVGTTKANGEDSQASKPLAIENILEGEHIITVKKDGFAEAVRHPVVRNSETEAVDVKLVRVFKANVEISTETGTYRGELKNQGPTSISVEIKPGMVRSFPREAIRGIRFLD